MSTEGEYLEMCNDLRDMYTEMKESLQQELAYCKEHIAYLEQDLQRTPQLKFVTSQFESDRPLVRRGVYAHYAPISFYNCRRCQKTHPQAYVCDRLH
jgi:hypothetical protein